MRLLLDTHAFLWWVSDASELSSEARRAIGAPRNSCFLSVASAWEMAIKGSLGKLKLRKPVEQFVIEQVQRNDFELLPIDLKHLGRVETLPFHHRDPFDRLLVAQARSERLTLVTADQHLSVYGIRCLW